MSYSLSKSSIVKGLQCKKSLFLHKKHPELCDPVDEGQQARFAQGNRVGELAQQLFPEGKDCSFTDFSEIDQSVEMTRKLIEQGEPIIYEAAFRYNHILVFADILVHDEEGWKMYEVKSATKVKDVYVQDAAIQSYVLKGCGIDLVDIFIVHINTQYVRKGALDVHQLFTSVSVKEDLEDLALDVPETVDRLRKVLAQDTIPEVATGAHCNEPYPCEFMNQCWKHMPENSIYEISRLSGKKKLELEEDGILKIEDIPDDFKLSTKQQLQVDGVKNGKSHMNIKKIEEFVSELEYPLYFLDFETINPAIPLYDYSRPYQQIPFQYSLHIQESQNGPCTHHEYLAESDGSDPRIKFIHQLIDDCGDKGNVVVYNKSFERSKLSDLANIFPSYAKSLNAINERMVDLMTPFQKGWYYTPEMYGSYSIKSVLPALVPELSYGDLEIGDGGTASNVFASMAAGDFERDFMKTRAALLAYCELDTWAMMKILEVLINKQSKSIEYGN